MRVYPILAVLAIALGVLTNANAEPVLIVAAENVYGDIAQQVGGTNVIVVSILNNPNQDPHEFEAAMSTARRVADARLVIVNGLNYDPWMTKLLAASPSASRKIIEVARLVDRRVGDNPHVWYDVAAISALGHAIAETLAILDPAHRSEYSERHRVFASSIRALVDRVAQLRKTYAGSAVTATEPVFGYMADALGLDMRNRRFQLAVMNGTEPGAKEIAALESDLRSRSVKALLYNAQTSSALTQHMREIAAAAGVPVVTITEMQPPGAMYQRWMASELEALEVALARP